MWRRALFVAFAACSCSTTSGNAGPGAPDASADGSSAGSPDGSSDAGVDAPADAGAVDWPLTFDPTATAGALDPALLGQYDVSGTLYHYDQEAALIPVMKTAGLAEWRVGTGRWEFDTQLLPTLTDGTVCDLSSFPAAAKAPSGTTDADLITARDWFTYVDGTPVTVDMTNDDDRYALAYVRSVLDVVTAFGAQPYVTIDHMPRALAASQTPVRTNAQWATACTISWTNEVSNVRPADADVFAAAAVGMVKRVVEGSGAERGRPVRYWEFWNEPELAYAWNPNVGAFPSTYLASAVATVTALDTYRKGTANADGKAIRIGLGSYASAGTAATIVAQFPGPLDFISFHDENDDDPLAVVAKIESVATARQGSASHQSAEIVLSEWSTSLQGSTLDPTTMDVALHHATVLALGAAAGLSRAHHAVFWDFFAHGSPGLGVVNHDFTPKPAYYAYTMLASLIGSGASRLAPAGYTDGKLDGGMGALLASKDSAGKVRVLLVNRNTAPRTATVGASPTAITVFDDPTRPPHAVPASAVVTIPSRSIVLVEL